MAAATPRAAILPLDGGAAARLGLGPR